jgi:hypothetical protein
MVLGYGEAPKPVFVVDRTQEHVDLLKRLFAKDWFNLSTSEQEQWRNEAAKGAYNHTDLNRVEAAVARLAADLGLTLTTKTDWTLWDVPTQPEMVRYLNNVAAVRDACPWEMNFPSLPDSMANLSYEMANNIEMVLLMVDTKNQTARSGEIYCGEV